MKNILTKMPGWYRLSGKPVASVTRDLRFKSHQPHRRFFTGCKLENMKIKEKIGRDGAKKGGN